MKYDKQNAVKIAADMREMTVSEQELYLKKCLNTAHYEGLKDGIEKGWKRAFATFKRLSNFKLRNLSRDPLAEHKSVDNPVGFIRATAFAGYVLTVFDEVKKCRRQYDKSDDAKNMLIDIETVLEEGLGDFKIEDHIKFLDRE